MNQNSFDPKFLRLLGCCFSEISKSKSMPWLKAGALQAAAFYTDQAFAL